jgi:hypothetical protein
VAGKYTIFRVLKGMAITFGENVEHPQVGDFSLVTTDSDLQAIVWVLDALQMRASASIHINYDYGHLKNKINDAT